MSHNLKQKVLLVGASQIALDYFKVLQALDCDITVVTRGQARADDFAAKTGVTPITGGVEKFLATHNIADFSAVLVAVGVEQLVAVGGQLISAGAKNILLEKPGGLDAEQIASLAVRAVQAQARVLVAYNRRFFASVLKAQEIIAADGGVKSFVFEFTEWPHVIEKVDRNPQVKASWLLANSTHVIDMAFFLGGFPKQIKCYAAGHLSWHAKSIFYGAGVADGGALFSYQANWQAPGRWAVEIMTDQHRLIFKPLEELQIQEKGTVAVNKVEIDNNLDINFKPGLYRELQAFLSADYGCFKTIGEQAKAVLIYEQIARGN